MKINIERISHNEQRYETCGDWWVDHEGVLQVRVSQMSNGRYEALLAIHEIVEVLVELTKRTGDWLPQFLKHLTKETDEFDKAYEAERETGDNESEPGYQPACPVYEGHMAASAIEHIVAMIMRVNYNEYAAEVAALSQDEKK